MKYFPLILLLIFSLFFLSCRDNNISDVDASDKVVLLDLSSVRIAPDVPELPKIISDESEEASSVAQNRIDFYRDDFDSFDPEFWTVIEEKTNNLIPDQAVFQDGNLIIEAAAADRNPLFHSIPIDVSPGDIIRIKRRALIHPGNEYANMSFRIYGTEGTDLTVSRDIKTEALATVQYLDFQYDEGRYPITKGVLASVPGYMDSGEYTAWEPLFDTWIDEELEYHTDTGLLRITINGQNTKLQGKPLAFPRFRVNMNAYGWHTGHRVSVDYLEIYVESPGSVPPGSVPGEVLVKELVQASLERVVVKTQSGISVSVPGVVSEEALELEIRTVELNDPEIIGAVDVRFGNIHEFDGAVKITLPVPEGIVPAEADVSEYLHPISYNTASGEWVPEPCIYSDREVTIISNHLSMFALKLGEGLKLEADSAAINSKQEAIELAWGSMNSNLSWGSQGHSFVSLVKDAPFLEVIGKQLGSVGTGFAIIDIAKNMAQGKDLEAGLGAIKLVSGWALGKLATLGTQIAGIGTFFIDYSLNTLATETFATQQKAFEKAYKAYYKSEGKTVYEWYEEIKKIIIEYDDSPEQVNVVINESINNYVKAIWKDEAAFEGYLADARGHGWAADAGLNDKIKTQLETNHKVLLGQTLQSAMIRALDWIETEAYNEQWRAAYKVKDFFKQDLRFWVDVFGNRADDKLDVVVLHENTPMLVIKPSSSGAVDFLGFMTLSEFFNGPRPTHILLQGYLQIDDNKIVPVSMKQSIVWDSFSPEISFDVDRSQYKEEEPEKSEEETEELIEEEGPEEDTNYTVSFDDVKNRITPEEIAEANYSIFDLSLASAARTETYPRSIEVSFGSLSETEKAPKDSYGEYLSFITITDSNGNDVASAHFSNTGYLEYAVSIPETGIGKTISADGMGHVLDEAYYLDGVLHGPTREFFSDGKIAHEMYHKNGELHGPTRAYYKNGQLESEGSYTNGKKEGLSLMYYENGQLWSKGFSKEWAAWGPYETYYENGQLSSKGQYLPYEHANEDSMGGEKIGYCRDYNEAGVLIYEEWYTEDGSFIESKSNN
jgi:antitoxin component YwqK of YwqJK toxin-antitoxin module